MKRKEELEILIADVTNKLETAGDKQKILRDAQKERVIKFFSEFLGLPKEQLLRTSFNDYSTTVSVKLVGATDFSSADITIRHPRQHLKNCGNEFFELGWFSSGASMKDEGGERNLLYLESLGKIAGDLRTGSVVSEFLKAEIEDEKTSSKLTRELGLRRDDMKHELKNIVNNELFDKAVDIGEIEFDGVYYANALGKSINKLSVEKQTDKTITVKFNELHYTSSETKRLNIHDGFNLIVDAMKFVGDLEVEFKRHA